jgi:hypothetical protein
MRELLFKKRHEAIAPVSFHALTISDNDLRWPIEIIEVTLQQKNRNQVFELFSAVIASSFPHFSPEFADSIPSVNFSSQFSARLFKQFVF